MPEDYKLDKDSSVSMSHGIRSGEPKRPESLIEIPNMVLEVPEISLCINPEKSQPLQSNGSNTFEDGHYQRHQQNEMFHRNKYESYNTWKAKNAQTLHNITGGLENIDPMKFVSSTKKSAGIVRKQNSRKEIHSSPIAVANHFISGATDKTNPTYQSKASAERSAPHNENYTQLQVSSNPSCNSYSVGHQHTGYPVHPRTSPRHYVRDSQKEFQETYEILKEPLSSSSNTQNHHGNVRTPEIISFTNQMGDKSNQGGAVVGCVPNYCNSFNCPCKKQKTQVNYLNGNNFVSEPPLNEELRVNNKQFIDMSKLYSQFDAGLIGNHLSSLTHIMNIQKDQISKLCQELNAQKILMSSLIEEVKQIRAVVIPEVQVNHDVSPTMEKHCKNCICEQKNYQGFRCNKSGDSLQVQTKHNDFSLNKQPPLSRDEVEKRSVGVMTSHLENFADKPVSSNEKNKSQKVKNDEPKSKKQNQKPRTSKSPSPNKNKLTNKKELTPREDKRKQQSNQTRRRKNKKGETNDSSQSDDSFSLDEAAVVMRAETDQGNFSPDASIHVNMPDYSASSADSDRSDSSDSDDEGEESGSEGESSDPQIGWTFYDRVVGQVNKMLKTSNDPRQEYAHSQRMNSGNILYQCNGDYETENNWSKRVTFDGPPLEDSDNNGMHMPRYQYFRTNQDYRMPGGPERMQDYMMCDYANGGSANVSFATYRYYQRHHLLPPPPPPPPDQVLFDSFQMKTKKNKSRKSEPTLPMIQKSHKRRSGKPSSKILDMSALKHQPKLF